MLAVLAGNAPWGANKKAMAETVINNPSATPSEEGTAAAGWIVALLIVAGIILAGVYVIPRMEGSTPTRDTNINVTIPEGVVPSTNSNSGGNAGSDQGGATQ